MTFASTEVLKSGLLTFDDPSVLKLIPYDIISESLRCSSNRNSAQRHTHELKFKSNFHSLVWLLKSQSKIDMIICILYYLFRFLFTILPHILSFIQMVSRIYLCVTFRDYDMLDLGQGRKCTEPYPRIIILEIYLRVMAKCEALSVCVCWYFSRLVLDFVALRCLGTVPYPCLFGCGRFGVGSSKKGFSRLSCVIPTH